MSPQKKISPFGQTVLPAIGNLYTNVLFYYIDFKTFLLEISIFIQNISNLRGVPVSSQESCLVEELLYSLVGNLTSHIQPTRSSSGGIEFQLDPSIDNSLKVVLLRFLTFS